MAELEVRHQSQIEKMEKQHAAEQKQHAAEIAVLREDMEQQQKQHAADQKQHAAELANMQENMQVMIGKMAKLQSEPQATRGTLHKLGDTFDTLTTSKFLKSKTGECPESQNGLPFLPIQSETLCKSAGKQLVPDVPWGSTDTWASDPKGCIIDVGKLWFNEGGQPSKSSAKVVLCVQAEVVEPAKTGTFEYKQMDDAKCVSPWKSITSVVQCHGSAAKTLGRQYADEITKLPKHRKDGMPWCYLQNGQLVFNGNGGAKDDSSDTTAKAICVKENKTNTDCPYNLRIEDDAAWCTSKENRNFCTDAKHEKYRDAQTQCRYTCNPECDPAVPHRGYLAPTYLPRGTVAPGHRFCADKYTIVPDTSDLLNRAAGIPTRSAVCGKCADQSFVLHPAFTSGGKIFGTCKPLVEHELYHEMDKMCRNTTDTSCAVPYPLPLKCQEFVGGQGKAEWPTYPTKWDTDINEDKTVEGRPIAFTCAQVSTVEFSDELTWYGTQSAKAVGPVYRLVRGDLAECHSENEKDPAHLKMSCTNHGNVKSCHMKKLELKPSNQYDSRSEALSEWESAKEAAFKEWKEGNATGWKPCDGLSLRKATSVARL